MRVEDMLEKLQKEGFEVEVEESDHYQLSCPLDDGSVGVVITLEEPRASAEKDFEDD